MEYQSTCVRHLAWCLFSEPMAKLPSIQPLQIRPDSEVLDWLTSLDSNPKPLVDYLGANNARLLGSYFECLWQFFFQNAPHWQLLKHHFQVFDGKQTLGELDILAKAEKCPAIHVELAVKFYLLQPNQTGGSLKHWLGPQSHDRFDLKLDKLAQKQLPMIDHPMTEQALKDQNLPLNWQQALCLKGYLFTHILQSNIQLHPHINQKALMGKWLHNNEADLILDKEYDWVVIPKPQWLGAYAHQPDSELTVLNSTQALSFINAHFTQDSYTYALMLVKLGKTYPHEKARYMVVHDQWPTQVKSKKR